MLIVNVQELKNIEDALRVYKRKVQKTQQMKNLGSRKEFTKPSVKRRKEIMSAKYRDSIKD